MAIWNLSLPDELKAFVEAQAARESFDTADAYLQALIVEAKRRHAERDRIDALLIEGINSGPATPMTVEDWNEVRVEVQRRHADRQRRANGA